MTYPSTVALSPACITEELKMAPEFPGPAYRIQTERLLIRCYHPEDAPLLHAAIQESLGHLQDWMPWAADESAPLQARIERMRAWRGKFDLGQDFAFGIFDPGEQRLLGSTGLHTRLGAQALEIGYWIHKDFINQGLATESSAALVRVAFEIERVNRVEIHCAPDNLRSAAVPRKLGFTHEATLRERIPHGETWRDSMIWSLFATEYASSPAAKAQIQAFDAIGRRLI
jgi:RimJ/RimL family protein N-acetyltransferase